MESSAHGQCKPDTGADITAISKSTFNSLPNQTRLTPTKIAHSSLGGKLQCDGQFITALTHSDKRCEVIFFYSVENMQVTCGSINSL